MFHLIKYSVIRKVKNFSMLFWPCMFPLILGTLFYFAFGNISESDFETVQAAFVEENPGDLSISVIPGRSQQRRNFDPCGNNDRKRSVAEA